MRAGLLTERITFFEEQTIKSPASGAIRKDFVEVQSIRAYRKKLSASLGNGINASEEFIANTLVFQVRKYSFIKESMQIGYNGKRYSITLLDEQSDNSYLITCSKINP